MATYNVVRRVESTDGKEMEFQYDAGFTIRDGFIVIDDPAYGTLIYINQLSIKLMIVDVVDVLDGAD